MGSRRDVAEGLSNFQYLHAVVAKNTHSMVFSILPD